MDKTRKLLLANKAWAQSKLFLDPKYFVDLAKDQKPDYLWIGCSDSRVPTSEITGTDPGELFVHRNIANQASPSDPNFLSVVQYAVEALRVKHIIVCGHYNCGGVKASFAPPPLTDVARWIAGIGETLRMHRMEIDAIRDEASRVNRLVELNVLAQLDHLQQIPAIQRAWESGAAPRLHGWVYDLSTGLLKDLKTVERPGASGG
jgi:carbonic anhydrase